MSKTLETKDRMQTRNLSCILLLAAALSLSACNAINGAGKDISAVGKVVSKSTGKN